MSNHTDCSVTLAVLTNTWEFSLSAVVFLPLERNYVSDYCCSNSYIHSSTKKCDAKRKIVVFDVIAIRYP